MSKAWPSGNSYLRLVSSLSQNPKKRMIFCTQSASEQRLVLEAIQQFAEATNFGKVQIVLTRKPDSNVGTIEVYVEGSKEMLS